MAKLTGKLKAAYDKVFAATTVEEISTSLDGFKQALPPRSQAKRAEIADILIQELDATPEPPARKLIRLVTLLATIDTPNAAAVVVRYANCDPASCDDRIQARSMISLSKMTAHDNTCTLLQNVLAQKSSNNRIRALALRLLINCSKDEPEASRQYADRLVTLCHEGNADQKWAVFRALRNISNLDPLPSGIEQRFITELIAPVLKEEFEWLDVQLQAALALGDVQSHLDEAMIQLSIAFQLSSDPTLRRYCIGSMRSVAQRMDKTQRKSSPFIVTMLASLGDKSSDVRSRAQAALKGLYKSQGAIDLIVDSLLQEETPPDGYVEALRHIDENRASKTLRNSLFHLDPDVVERASNALIQLGGVQAFRTMFAQKRQVIKQYTQILNDADEKIMEQYDLMMGQARWAFWISMAMHSLIFLVGIGILIVALYSLWKGDADIWKSLFGAAGGVVAVILALFYKNPFDNIGRSVTRLVKVNVAFLGYMRQINQIDATFKQLFLDTSGFTLDEMEATVRQIQVVVNQSLRNIQNYLLVDGSPAPEDLEESSMKNA